MNRLPSRIMTVMIGTILAFVLAFGFALLLMTRALNEQVRKNSLRHVASALANVASEMDAMNLE